MANQPVTNPTTQKQESSSSTVSSKPDSALWAYFFKSPVEKGSAGYTNLLRGLCK